MQCFNTIKKFIVAPALVIALTAGSVKRSKGWRALSARNSISITNEAPGLRLRKAVLAPFLVRRDAQPRVMRQRSALG
ncbi:hypothetical protein MACH17_06380 [Phaeobacter inhibens]|nr:hypothetical protein MACH17_06380 [Phaeobacter inhibens]